MRRACGGSWRPSGWTPGRTGAISLPTSPSWPLPRLRRPGVVLPPAATELEAAAPAPVRRTWASLRHAYMTFQAPDHVAPIVIELEISAGNDQRGLQQRQQRGEVLIVAIVGSGGEQQQRTRILRGEPSGQPETVGEFVVVAAGGEMVGFVDDDDIPAARGEFPES